MIQQAFELLGRAEVLVVGLGVAAFLTLFWVVRGAPIGQGTAEEPGEAPRPGYRDRVVALAVVGFLMILGGAAVAGRFGIPWALPCFGAGFALILGVMRANRRYRHVSPTLRRVLEFSDTALTVSLLGGILLVANVFAFRYGGRALDFTRDEAFSLSTMSVNAARGVKLPLKFTLVLGRSSRSTRQRDRVRQLVDLYKAANPSMISVDEVVAFSPEQSSAFESLVKRAPEVGMMPGDAVLVEYGEGDSAGHAVLGVAEMFRDPGPQSDPNARAAIAFNGEDAVTTTIDRFLKGKRSLVAFTGGHGEPSIAEMDPRQPGLGLWRARLASGGYDAVELKLIQDEIPPDLALMIVVAPRARFQDQEVAKLEAYMARGGPLLVLMNGLTQAGLEDLLALHNVGFDPGIIVDPMLNATGRPNLALTPPLARGDHPINEPLVGMYFLMPNASPIHLLGTRPPEAGKPRPGVNPAMILYPLLKTGPSSWAETDFSGNRPEFDKDKDRPGPHVVAVGVAERPEVAAEGRPRARLVVISTGQMAFNSTIGPDLSPSNADLLMNAIQWLRGKADSVGVAPKVHNALTFSADPNLRTRLHAVPTIFALMLIVGLGVTTWLARRS